MMDLLRFYRFRDWYANMGISLIGVLSTGVLEPLLSAVLLVQIALIQMYAFSLNDYYDYRYEGEDSQVGRFLERGVSHYRVLLIVAAPLVLMVALAPFSGVYTLLLVAAAVLPYLYQGPARLKNNFVLSLLINSVGLGLLTYVYPYIVLRSQPGPLFWFFSLLFLLYMAFYEVAHQIEDGDRVSTVVDAFGFSRAMNLASTVLVTAGISGVAFAVWNPVNAPLYAGALVFNAARLWRMRGMERGETGRIRRSWHKFYSAHEGVFYVTVLVLGQVGVMSLV